MEDRSHARGADAQGPGVSNKDYLNGLVEASGANTANQACNVAFVKTHKTGSTSMAAILYRYALRHNRRLARLGRKRIANLSILAGKVQTGELQRVDVLHYHICGTGHLRDTWSEARENYREIMQDPDGVNFITLMREPRSHFLSYYYYFLEPVNKLSIEEYLTRQPSEVEHFELMINPLSGEFGVSTLVQLEHLIAHELSSFKLILLTERFDEGLMVLRSLLGWDMIDMTYMSMKISKAGSNRWDGKPLIDRPSFDDLPEQVQNKIDALTELDQLLYTASQDEYGKRLQPVSGEIEADLAEFARLQSVVGSYLDANDSSKANALYRAEDWFDLAPPLNPF